MDDHPLFQQTLLTSFECEGIALHSGQFCKIVVESAPENHGFVFVRSDLSHTPHLAASYKNVVNTFLCTQLGNKEGETIGVIEHLMAAFALCHIDNALIRLEGVEVPFIDGSALPFIECIEKVGIKTQSLPRRFINILKTVRFQERDRWAELSPADHFSVEVAFDFHGRQGLGDFSLHLATQTQDLKQEIGAARSFGFYEDAEKLYAKGFSLGASLENTIVIKAGRVINPQGLRFEDEFVRHKILDAIGDLYLAGAPLNAKFRAYNSSHEIHHKLLQSLLDDPLAWEWEDKNSYII